MEALRLISLFLSTALLRVASTQDPSQISLTYGNDPSEMVVMWISGEGKDDGSEPVPEGEVKGICEFGLSKNALTESAPATVSTYKMNSYASPLIYKANLTGLTAGNTDYFYRVGWANTTANSVDKLEWNWSQVYSFKSHPDSDSDSTSPIAFFMIGDIGQTDNSLTTFQELDKFEWLLTAKTGIASGGIIELGDLSYANGDQPKWDTFGDLKQPTTARIPMMTTVGNHEWFDSPNFDFRAYLARYSNPPVSGAAGSVRELYYSFDVGLVHWVMVAGYCKEMKSTLTQPCLAKNSPELIWLQADLKAVDRDRTPWVFVVFHQPYVNSNTAHSMNTEGKPMRAAIEDTLYEAKVDLVFSGHVHAYERSCQVYQYTCVDGAPYYITLGDGGNHEGLASDWIDPQPEWSMYRQASYGFGALLVNNATHVQWQWHQNGDLAPAVADDFTLIKGDTSCNKPLEKNTCGSARGTGKGTWVDGERGLKAKAFNERALKQNRENRRSA